MSPFLKVTRFLVPYLRRYRGRLVLGILLGMMFGFSNASFLWATKTLINRMAPDITAAAAAAADGHPAGAAGSGAEMRPPSRLEGFKRSLEILTHNVVDDWLPRTGRPLDWRQVVGGLAFFPLLIGMRGLVGYGSSYLTAWVGERVVNDLRLAVFSRLITLSLGFFHRAKTGDLITRVNSDTATLQRYTSNGINTMVSEPFTLLFVFAGLCLIDWRLTLGAAAFVPICLVPVIWLGRKARRASKASIQLYSAQSSRLIEMLSGLRVIKAFGLEQVQIDHYRKLAAGFIGQQMRSIRAKEQVNPIVETISMFGFGLLIVYIAAGQKRVDDMAAFLTGLVLFYTPIRKLAVLHVMLEQSLVAVNRLMQILDETPSVKPPVRPRRITALSSEIRFQGVSFAYEEQPVLIDLNLSIRRGEKIGMAGESGSGKSTVVNLLFRFYDPTEGAILIDGMNLKEFGLDDLRRLMALVSQEVVIFDQTVAENIAAGRPGATRDEVEEAARAAFAHEFIVRLPKGYDTPVGERGASLSVGQRQRLSIARAFVRNAPILVLDEATAALDSNSEAEVQAAIERLEENRTVLCVAHRLSTLAQMDRIVVLSRGRLVEQGGFDELLRRDGLFAGMARKQGMLTQQV
jgi:ATP-binding cassette, subfamily B, bacterial MsbA